MHQDRLRSNRFVFLRANAGLRAEWSERSERPPRVAAASRRAGLQA